MNDSSASNTNLLLYAFLQGGDDRASVNALAELVNSRIEPLVKAAIRGKLHVSLRPDDERRVNQDAFDLVSEVKILLVGRLTKLKSDNAAGTIDSLEAYVKTVTTNACNHYLRKKYPNRLRLKNQLRYILTHDKRFSLWRSEAGDWRCGSLEWQNTKLELARLDGSDGLSEKLSEGGIFPDRIELVDLVAEVFGHFHVPLRFGDLVNIVSDLRQLTEPVEVSGDEALTKRSAFYESDQIDRLEQAAFLKTLWDEICLLPLRHRTAMLLNLKNGHGEGLITLLPLTRVATISQIASLLEFPAGEFAKIWNDLPWDDLAIAEHLNLTRQKVINLRQSARATLRRRLNYF